MIIRLIVYETEFQEEQDKPLVDERIQYDSLRDTMRDIQELLEESWLGDWEEDLC